MVVIFTKLQIRHHGLSLEPWERCRHNDGCILTNYALRFFGKAKETKWSFFSCIVIKTARMYSSA